MNTKTALLLFCSLTAFAVGCTEALDQGEGTGSNEQSDRAGTESDVVLLDGLPSTHRAIPAVPKPIAIEPANGTVFPLAFTAGLQVAFNGFTTTAAQSVEVQILSAPNATIEEDSWVTIGTATSDSEETTFNDDTPIFRWSLKATPSPDGSRWPQGGVLRYRAVAIDDSGKKTALPFFDESAGTCIAENKTKSWKDVLKACQSPFSPGLGADLKKGDLHAAALVSPTPEPGLGVTPNYLSRRGTIEAVDTDEYYDIIDAPRTLADYRLRFGFDRGNEVGALYFNRGDLGIGREMHCTTFRDTRGEPGTACYVRNYGVDEDKKPVFSGIPASAMADAVQGQNSFATVAMVKYGDKFAPSEGNDVQFFVYNAKDEIVDQAQLDSVASNTSIPTNCANCHGGKFDNDRKVLTGSSFLPFDPDSFLYATPIGPFSYSAQEDQFRELNAMMQKAGAPPSTVQYIDGIYGGHPERSGKADLDWIPKGWSGSEEAKTVYREVYKPYCRTCHTSQVGDFAFIRYEDFKDAAEKVLDDVCNLGEMPVCEATMRKFWESPARAYLLNSINATSACTPRSLQ